RRAQVHVRVDERGREDEALRLDDTVRVRLEVGPERRDDAVVDAEVRDGVHSLRRVDDPRAADDDVLVRRVLAEQHHATSTGSPTCTGAGEPTSRSYRTAIRVTRPARTCVSISASA